MKAEDLDLEKVRLEAQRRAKWIQGHGMGQVGYRDGYEDGFEHAILWLLGKADDPFELTYTEPGAGMDFFKKYYAGYSKRAELKKCLESFKTHIIDRR